jgi:hypothetical protein
MSRRRDPTGRVSSSNVCGPAACPKRRCASTRGSRMSAPAPNCDSGSGTILTSGRAFALDTFGSLIRDRKRGGQSCRPLAAAPSRLSTARVTPSTTMQSRSRTTCSRRFAGSLDQGDLLGVESSVQRAARGGGFSGRFRRSGLTSPCGPCAAVRVTRSTAGIARPTAAL